MARLDSYGKFPSGMAEYMELNNWAFSKKLADWAISKMKKKNPQTGREEPLTPMTKEQVDEMLKKYNVKLEKDNGYDSYWCANMAMADYMKSSISDEQHLALFLKDFIDDTDGYEGKCLTTFYANCIGKGVVIPWESLI